MARATKSTKAAKTEVGATTSKSGANKNDYQIIHAPVITEKSSLIGAAGNVVVFRVDPKSTKPEIKGAIQRIYKVEVAAVRTVRNLGKMKRTMKGIGRKNNFKKAYVTLKPGQTIDVVEGL